MQPTSSRQTVSGAGSPYRRAALALAVGWALAALVFTLWPQIDLRVSAWFYRPGQGFPFAQAPVPEVVRKAIWRLSEIVAIGSLVLLALAALRVRLWSVPARVWGFVVLLYVLGPGLLVDALLKSHWGRARPADIVDFGGSRTFTPALLPADQCADNCSFVSGEGSGAASLAVALFVIVAALSHRLPPAASTVLRGVAIVLGVVGCALRIAAGRHFLSDTVFAVLLVLTVALALHRMLLHRVATPDDREPSARR